MALLGADTSNPSAGDAGTTLTVHEAADRIAKRSEALAAAPPPEPRKRPTAAVAADEPPPPVDDEEDLTTGGEGADAPEAPAEGDGTAEDAGDKGDEPDPETAEIDLTRKVKVKVGGKEIEIPLSEALSGYQREADYRQKTQAVAEERRAAEEAKRAATEHATAVQAERQQLAQVTNALKTQLLGQIPTEAQLAELARTNRTEYLFAIEQIRQQVARVKALDDQAAEALGRTEQEAKAQLAKVTEEGNRRVAEMIPEARDPEKWGKRKVEIAALIQSYGYTPSDIAKLVDPRLVKFAHDALNDRKDAEAYRKLQQRQASTTQRVTEAPRVARPGAAASSTTSHEARVKELRNKAAKTGTVNSIADLIAAKTARR